METVKVFTDIELPPCKFDHGTSVCSLCSKWCPEDNYKCEHFECPTCGDRFCTDRFTVRGVFPIPKSKCKEELLFCEAVCMKNYMGSHGIVLSDSPKPTYVFKTDDSKP